MGRTKIIALYLFALFIRIVVAIPLMHDWDGYVFGQTAKNFIQGETPYQTVLKNDPTIYPDSNAKMGEQWYAYPPLPLLMFTAPVFVYSIFSHNISNISPPVLNFLIKIPFILGDLVAAFLVYTYLKNKGSKRARLAEVLMLFNPLFIWVSSAWGMFDMWIFVFLLLSYMLFSKQKYFLTGVSFALSLCIKLFPIFFIIPFFACIFSVAKDTKSKVSVLLGMFVTLCLINIPFFATSPHGFLNQNFLMHVTRPPQGISIPGIFDIYGKLYEFQTSQVLIVSTFVMLLILFIFYSYSLLYKLTEERSLIILFFVYIAVLLFNKVTNEQYFVVLCAFAILLTSLPFTKSIKIIKTIRAIELYVSIGVLFASSFLGFHFIGFLLPTLAKEKFSESANQIVFYLSRYFNLPLYTYPDSVFTYYNFPIFLATLALLPFYILSLYLLIKVLPYFVSKIRDAISPLWLYVKHKEVNIFTFSVGFNMITFLCLSTFLLTYLNAKYELFKPVELLAKSDAKLLPSEVKVGTYYYVWWNNFSHDENYAGDAWDLAALNPQTGYYTSKNSFFAEHIRQMKSIGIDFAVVPYHLYDRARYLTFSEYAGSMGLYYAPMIELNDVLNFDHLRPTDFSGNTFLGFKVSEESKEEVVSVIESAVVKTYSDPAHLRINNKPVIYLYDSHWYFPSWDAETKNAFAEAIVKRYSANNKNAYEEVSKAWGVSVTSISDILMYYPRDVIAFSDATPQAFDFRHSFLDMYETYWKEIRAQVEAKVGPVYFITTYAPTKSSWQENPILPSDPQFLSSFDAQNFYSPSNTWTSYKNVSIDSKLEIWEGQVSEQEKRAKENSFPLIVPVIPQYDDTKLRKDLGFTIPEKIQNESLLENLWHTAEKSNADYIMITSWNEFFEGTSIEASREKGDRYLKEVKVLSGEFKK